MFKELGVRYESNVYNSLLGGLRCVGIEGGVPMKDVRFEAFRAE